MASVAATVTSLFAPDAPIALPAGASGRAALTAAAAALGLPPVRAARLTLALARTGAIVVDIEDDAGIVDGGGRRGGGEGPRPPCACRGPTPVRHPLPDTLLAVIAPPVAPPPSAEDAAGAGARRRRTGGARGGDIDDDPESDVDDVFVYREPRNRIAALLCRAAVAAGAPKAALAVAARVPRSFWAALILWPLGAKLASAHDLGPIYIIFTIVAGVYLNLGARREGDASAYTIFNGFRALAGQFTGDDVDAGLRRGQM